MYQRGQILRLLFFRLNSSETWHRHINDLRESCISTQSFPVVLNASMCNSNLVFTPHTFALLYYYFSLNSFISIRIQQVLIMPYKVCRTIPDLSLNFLTIKFHM